jgi:catechol 2,3-dioxygenase-like lactoylglutathione lyase family enzyme
MPTSVLLESQKKEIYMKRLHVHVAVDDLSQSIQFYSALFAAEPIITKPDYAKWMLDDPKVNFAISQRSKDMGVDHLGIQVETEDELKELYGRLRQAGRPVLEEGNTVCCYAKSEKSWITDPQDVLWEAFLTTGESTVYGTSVNRDSFRRQEEACCTPETPQGVCCAPKPELTADAPCCGK